MKEGVASVTARRVAAHRLTFARASTTFGRPDDDVALARDVASGIEVPTGRMHRYLEARTAFFDDVVLDALDGGVTQLVVVGAGYDGRALRFARDGARWFEIDHPATQADKRARLDRLGLATHGITFVSVDLSRDDLAGALRDAGLDDAGPTTILIEGVASYLTEAVLTTTLASLRLVAAPGSRLAISLGLAAVADDDESAARVARFKASVDAMGEPILNDLRGEAAVDLLARTGWLDGGSALDLESRRAMGFVVASPAPGTSP